MDCRSSVNSFEKLIASRKEMRLDETRDQLKLIEDNQRAAFLVRLFEAGEMGKVRQLAAVG